METNMNETTRTKKVHIGLPRSLVILVAVYNLKPKQRYLSRIQWATDSSQLHARNILSFLTENGYIRKSAIGYRTYYELTLLGEQTAIAIIKLMELLPKQIAERDVE